MTVGVMALAVPLSSNFAGEFLILAGVFQTGWGYAVIGAAAIVLAAMYMLRLISAVLHQDVGPAVSDAALDLRGGELAIVVPLVAILLFLSAWPAAITGHSFAGTQITTTALAVPPTPESSDSTGWIVLRAAMLMTTIDTPSVDWFALSPVLAMIAAAGALLMVAVFVPRDIRRTVAAAVCGAGFVAAFVLAILVARPQPGRRDPGRRHDLPRPLGRRRAGADRRAAASSRCSSRTASAGATSTWPSTTRCSPRPAPAWRSSSRPGA